MSDHGGLSEDSVRTHGGLTTGKERKGKEQGREGNTGGSVTSIHPPVRGRDLDTDLRAIAHVVAAIRHGWDKNGIMVELRRCYKAGHSYDEIADAAINAARTTSTVNPGGIGARLTGGWRTKEPETGPTPVVPRFDRKARAEEIAVAVPPTEAYLAAKKQLREGK